MLGEYVDEQTVGELGNQPYFTYGNVKGVDEPYLD
jgi:hypothetical protein